MIESQSIFPPHSTHMHGILMLLVALQVWDLASYQVLHKQEDVGMPIRIISMTNMAILDLGLTLKCTHSVDTKPPLCYNFERTGD